MSIIEKVDKLWRQIETYQNLKELFSFLGDNEKKEYARCILKWAASSDNQDRSHDWNVNNAVTQCCKNGDEVRNREVMKQTFGLMKVYGFATLDESKENILFILDGIEAGRILSKTYSSIIWYEFILSVGWLASFLAIAILYLDFMKRIGVLHSKTSSLQNGSWEIFFLPLILTTILFFAKISRSLKIFAKGKK